MEYNFHSVVHDDGIVQSIINELPALDLHRFAATCKKARELAKKFRTEVTTSRFCFYQEYTALTDVTIVGARPADVKGLRFPPTVRSIRMNQCRINLRTMPKSVTSLDVNSIEGTADLPNLESLSLVRADIRKISGFASLKKFYTDMISMGPADVFPPFLTDLTIYEFDLDDPIPGLAMMMPRTLIRLKVCFSEVEHTEGWLMKDLPIGLEELEFDVEEYKLEEDDFFHPNLKNLRFFYPDSSDDLLVEQELHKLPRGLRKLSIYLGPSATGEMMEKLPPNLIDLSICCKEIEAEVMRAIPKTVTILNIDAHGDYFCELDPKDFPPNLVCLDFSGRPARLQVDDISKLPSSLTALSTVHIVFDNDLGIDFDSYGDGYQLQKQTADFRHLSCLTKVRYEADFPVDVLLPNSVTLLSTGRIPIQYPPNLMALRLTTLAVGKEELSNLPDSLTMLSGGDLSWPKGVKIPPNLICMTVQKIDGVKVSMLPKSLDFFHTFGNPSPFIKKNTLEKSEWTNF